MKKTLITIACFAAMGAAHATYCPDNSPIGDHVNNDCHAPFKNPTQNPVGSTSESSSTAGALAAAGAVGVGLGIGGNSLAEGGAGGAGGTGGTGVGQGGAGGIGQGGTGIGGRQQQQQGQQQGQQLNNRNDNSSGVVIQGNQAGSGDRYEYTAWALPSLNVAVSAVPTATMMPIVRRCDARVRVYSESVTGWVRGPFGGMSEVVLGHRDNIEPWRDENGNVDPEPFQVVNVYERDVYGNYVRTRRGDPIIIEQRLIGSEVVGGMTAITSSSGASLIGSLLDGGRGISAGAGTSTGLQQQTQVLNVFPCVYATRRVQLVAININIDATQKIAAPAKPRPPRQPRARVIPCETVEVEKTVKICKPKATPAPAAVKLP